MLHVVVAKNRSLYEQKSNNRRPGTARHTGGVRVGTHGQRRSGAQPGAPENPSSGAQGRACPGQTLDRPGLPGVCAGHQLWPRSNVRWWSRSTVP